MAERSATFVVERVYSSGSRWVISRSPGATRAAHRVAGEYFEVGDTIRCGELEATVRDVIDQGALVVDVDAEDLAVGQTWELL